MNKPPYLQCAVPSAQTTVHAPLSVVLDTYPCVMGVVYHNGTNFVVPTVSQPTEGFDTVQCFVLDGNYIPTHSTTLTEENILKYDPIGVWDFKLLFAKSLDKPYKGHYSNLLETLPTTILKD